MSKKLYLSMLGAVAALVVAGVAAFGQGQLILSTLTGSELFAVQTAGPRSAAISATNLATWVNAGGGGASPGAFTTLSASSTVSGAGFTARFATPGPIGSTTASTGAFTTLAASGAVSGAGITALFASPPAIGGTAAAAGKFTTLEYTTAAGLNVAVTDDTALTTSTLCQDTTTHVVYSGSGAAGICAGTSSLRFKHDVAGLRAGLKQVMELEPISYKLNADHGDPNRTLYGFSAEQGGEVLPELMRRDKSGNPNTFDYLGVVPVLVKALQEQQAQIEELKRRIPEKQALR